jgi:hypothetical protein
MEARLSGSEDQLNCRHEKGGILKLRSFDIVNGFEVVIVKCCDCDKALELRISKIRDWFLILGSGID